MLKWHHYMGLGFGAFTLTWVFSGLLSMDPWAWSPSTAPTTAQRDAIAGGPVRWGDLTLDRLRIAARTLATEVPVKEIEILQFRGELVAEAFRAPDGEALLSLPLGDPGAVIAPLARSSNSRRATRCLMLTSKSRRGSPPTTTTTTAGRGANASPVWRRRCPYCG
jgi:hypothetical protein